MHVTSSALDALCTMAKDAYGDSGVVVVSVEEDGLELQLAEVLIDETSECSQYAVPGGALYGDEN